MFPKVVLATVWKGNVFRSKVTKQILAAFPASLTTKIIFGLTGPPKELLSELHVRPVAHAIADPEG
jgi:hypothetical protein